MRGSILLKFFSVKDSVVLDFLQETAQLCVSVRNNKNKSVLTKCSYVVFSRNQTGVYEHTLHDGEINSPNKDESFEIIGETVR